MVQKNQDILKSFLTQFSDLEISKHFREKIYEIVDLVKSVSGYTTNLESKVDGLLYRQEQQFFRAYKTHLQNLNEMVKRLEDKIIQQQKKIHDYESQGALSAMIKKSYVLEKDLMAAYRKLQTLEKSFQSTKINLQISLSQQERLREKIRQLMKEQNINTKKEIANNVEEQEKEKKLRYSQAMNQFGSVQKQFFPTQILYKSKEKLTKPTIDSRFKNSISNSIEAQNKKITGDDNNNNQNNSLIKKRLQNEIVKLQKRNKSLLQSNVRIVDLQNELSNFFFNCVQSIKKNVLTRNRINYCTLEDFKKQDKLNVLIMMLGNQKIISAIHQMIFPNQLAKKNSSIFDKSHQKQIQLSQRSPTNNKFFSAQKIEKQLKLPGIGNRRLKNTSHNHIPLQLVQYQQENS